MQRNLTVPRSPLATSIPASQSTSIIPSFDRLPDSAFIRESQLVQSHKRPDKLAPMPFSGPTLWRKVKAGTWPKPVKLSQRVSAWIVGECRIINAARIAGSSDAEIRELVTRIHAARTNPTSGLSSSYIRSERTV